MNRIILPLVLLAAAGVVLSLLASQQRSGLPTVSGVIELDDIRVGSRVGGRVLAVHVAEGAQVRGGEVLVELEPFDLRERLAEARSALAARRAVVARLDAGARPEEIAQAEARRDRAAAAATEVRAGRRAREIAMLEAQHAMSVADHEDARREVDRLRPLFEGGEATVDEFERARLRLENRAAALRMAAEQLALAREGSREEQIAQAAAQLAEFEAALALLREGPRAEDRDEARATAQAAEAAVAALERQIEELTVRAPCDGFVEALDLRPGDLVPPNAPLLTIVDPASLRVRAFVPQSALSLRSGDAVQIRVDALPGRTFGGEVTFVSRAAEFTPANAQTPEERSRQVYRIRVLLREGRDVLRPGMTADVLLPPAADAAP